MGRVYKDLVFWARTPKGKRRPQVATMQIDTGADRTILARMPPGGEVVGHGCINGKDVDLIEIGAVIQDTNCQAILEVAIPKHPNDLPAVIGADFLQQTEAIIDYDGEIIGCPPGKRRRKGFADAERTGVMRFVPGLCKKR